MSTLIAPTASAVPVSPAESAAASAADRDAITRWLSDFAAAVRGVDYEAGRAMFDPDAVGFGTFARMEIGRDNLVENQWKKIWGCTRGFVFFVDQAHVSVQGDLAWIATPWHSQGRDQHGGWFDRHGRATLVLRREHAGGAWRCVHSHYSAVPIPRSNGDPNATPV